MTIFRLLHLRRFFEHRLRTFLSLAGVAIGGALVVAVLGMFGSLEKSVNDFVEALTGVADLEVTGISAEGFDEKLIFPITETDGVKAAVPLVQDSVLIRRAGSASGERVSRQTLLIGLDQRAEALGTDLSREEESNLRARATTRPGLFLGERVAKETGLKTGSIASVYTNAGQAEVEILGVISGDAGGFNQGKFAATALPLAQSLTGKQGRLSSVLIVLEPGANPALIERQIFQLAGGSAFVSTPERRTEQAQEMTNELRFGMLMGVGMALVVGGFLIFNTMSMAATERRRELATLRALGGRRGKLLTLFLLEAAAIGLLGSAIGAAAGILAARELVNGIPPFVRSAIGMEIAFSLPPYAVPTGIFVGMAAAVIASLIPAARAVGISPVESMRPEGVLESLDGGERVAWGPTLVGIGFMLGGGVGAFKLPGGWAVISVATLLAGIIVLSYGLTALIARLTARFATLGGAGGRLAGAAIERAPRRSWATTVAVLTASMMVVAQGALFSNLNGSISEIFTPLEKIDLYVSADIDGFGTDVQLPPDWLDDFRAIDGVSTVGLNVFRFLSYKGGRVLLQGVEGTLEYVPQLQGVSEKDIQRVKAGKAATISRQFSDIFGIDKGDTLKLPTPKGPKDLEVVGVVKSVGWGGGLVTVSRQTFVEEFGHTRVGDYSFVYDEGADNRKILAEVQEIIEGSPIKPYVVPGDQFIELALASINQVNALFGAMSTIVVFAAGLGVLNSLLISIVERRRELGIMRAIGTSRRQLRRMVAIEAGAMGLVGAALGALSGFLLHRVAIGPIILQAGFPIDYEFVGDPALTAFVIGVGIAVLGSVIPARRAGSINIIEAIGYE